MLTRKLGKEQQKEMLKRMIDVLLDSIEYAKKEPTDYTIGIAQGKWEVLHSIRNMLKVYDVSTEKLDALLEKAENEIDELIKDRQSN